MHSKLIQDDLPSGAFADQYPSASVAEMHIVQVVADHVATGDLYGLQRKALGLLAQPGNLDHERAELIYTLMAGLVIAGRPGWWRPLAGFLVDGLAREVLQGVAHYGLEALVQAAPERSVVAGVTALRDEKLAAAPHEELPNGMTLEAPGASQEAVTRIKAEIARLTTVPEGAAPEHPARRVADALRGMNFLVPRPAAGTKPLPFSRWDLTAFFPGGVGRSIVVSEENLLLEGDAHDGNELTCFAPLREAVVALVTLRYMEDHPKWGPHLSLLGPPDAEWVCRNLDELRPVFEFIDDTVVAS
jgi:hypothetical protein